MTVTLLNGDCLDVLPALAAGSADFVLVDPPFGATDCAWDAVIPFAPMWEQLRRVVRPGATLIFKSMQPFTSALIMSNPRWFRQELIWDKLQSTDPQLANVRPLRRHENLIVFCARRTTYNPQMVEREKPLDQRKWKTTTDGDIMRIRNGKDTRRVLRTHRYPTSILPFSSLAGECNSTKRVHPTQTPVELLAYLIRTYSNPGDTVLDFCMGSGSCGVAAMQEGRDFIGIEKEAEYFAIAQQRIANAQPALTLEGVA